MSVPRMVSRIWARLASTVVTVNLLDGTGTTVLDTTVTANSPGQGQANEPPAGQPGWYWFDALVPGKKYVIEVVLPGPEWTFTIMDAGGDDALDSDVIPATGQTPDPILDPGEKNPTIDAGLIPPPIDLEIEKEAIPEVVNPGTMFSYQVTVSNIGASTATNVRILDALPARTVARDPALFGAFPMFPFFDGTTNAVDDVYLADRPAAGRRSRPGIEQQRAYRQTTVSCSTASACSPRARGLTTLD